MSKTKKKIVRGRGRQRRLFIRGVRREQPDYRRLSKALIEYLAAQDAAAEAAAQAQHEQRSMSAQESKGD